jgi:hypothetical protein
MLGCLASLSFVGCVGEIGNSEDGDGTNTTSDALCVVDAPLRRMTRFEYNNTVRDLLGDTTHPADRLPPEEEIKGFDNQAAALTVSDLLAEQYMKVAEDVAGRATADMSTLLPGCDPVVDGDTACATEFIATFGRRAFRRTLTDEEQARFLALFEAAMADPELATFPVGIELVISAMLQSPYFLYRPEFGGADPLAMTDVVRLTDSEMASKLSYMLWNTMPDEELLAAADAGELRTKEQLEAQARRMLSDDRARDAIWNFHRQWLGITHIDSISKDTSVYPAFDADVAALWEEELHAFTESVVVDGDAKLSTLLTAPYSYMNADLAALYGADVTDSTPPTGAELEQVSLDPARRAGIVTQGAVLATLAKGNRTSPVFRGKFVREQLLCESLPIPPANLVIVPPDLDPQKTTREQFEEIGANPDCSSCHALMNPIGFGFEHYDAMGLWRDTQNDKPIDATGEIIGSEDVNGAFDGAVELANQLAGSESVAECVSSQWFRFSYNRTVTPEDRCNLDQINEAFAASDHDIRELLIALTQTDTFSYRHQVVAEGGMP